MWHILWGVRPPNDARRRSGYQKWHILLVSEISLHRWKFKMILKGSFYKFSSVQEPTEFKMPDF
jgi:hypothetical protein